MMKDIIIRFSKLLFGLFICSVGIVMLINAGLGLGPWDVFHQGVSLKTGITIGQASICTGFVIVIFTSFFGERLGWGTLLNTVLIGLFMDFLMLNNIIPVVSSLPFQIFMISGGMFLIGIGSYYYMSAELGSGPRDGLMVVIAKRSSKSVQFIRNSIEISALTVGYFLGGFFGIGTVIIALTIGHFVQLAFKLFRFDVSKIHHRFIDDDIRWMAQKIVEIKNKKAA
ncbi:Uncharacterized membrane protein YczE [Peptoclostridium litorale DSM 5388]|uniref:Putative membrane protein n=1 Tax=Peptoclostridium litorale DSM 5388 TaxID=1121324 RepID=A0A069RKV8_PEPLI|nr:hypothetical protein [Peptoclostridium litorale]KDR96760.1 putative membrane protein [Peptoclostridium litorale DSM 5388]SIO34721.1 Uncharacterized membrane protein YczE [Peptoclostridium litorale DSM 5388]